jgi:uncharacterized protein
MSPTEETREVEALVRDIAKALVDIPEAVSLEAVSADRSTVFRLRVHPTEAGKVIGKQGRNARAVRILLSAVSAKLRHQYSLEIVEGERQQGEALAADHAALPA